MIRRLLAAPVRFIGDVVYEIALAIDGAGDLLAGDVEELS